MSSYKKSRTPTFMFFSSPRKDKFASDFATVGPQCIMILHGSLSPHYCICVFVSKNIELLSNIYAKSEQMSAWNSRDIFSWNSRWAKFEKVDPITLIGEKY